MSANITEAIMIVVTAALINYASSGIGAISRALLQTMAKVSEISRKQESKQFICFIRFVLLVFFNTIYSRQMKHAVSRLDHG